MTDFHEEKINRDASGKFASKVSDEPAGVNLHTRTESDAIEDVAFHVGSNAVYTGREDEITSRLRDGRLSPRSAELLDRAVRSNEQDDVDELAASVLRDINTESNDPLERQFVGGNPLDNDQVSKQFSRDDFISDALEVEPHGVVVAHPDTFSGTISVAGSQDYPVVYDTMDAPMITTDNETASRRFFEKYDGEVDFDDHGKPYVRFEHMADPNDEIDTAVAAMNAGGYGTMRSMSRRGGGLKAAHAAYVDEYERGQQALREHNAEPPVRFAWDAYHNAEGAKAADNVDSFIAGSRGDYLPHGSNSHQFNAFKAGGRLRSMINSVYGQRPPF